jgi:hypothetical protein
MGIPGFARQPCKYAQRIQELLVQFAKIPSSPEAPAISPWITQARSLHATTASAHEAGVTALLIV